MFFLLGFHEGHRPLPTFFIVVEPSIISEFLHVLVLLIHKLLLLALLHPFALLAAVFPFPFIRIKFFVGVQHNKLAPAIRIAFAEITLHDIFLLAVGRHHLDLFYSAFAMKLDCKLLGGKQAAFISALSAK